MDDDPCGRSEADTRDICGEEEDDALKAAWTSDDSPMMGGSSKSPEWLAASMAGPPRDPNLNCALDKSDRGLPTSLTLVRRGIGRWRRGASLANDSRPQLCSRSEARRGDDLIYSAAGGGIAVLQRITMQCRPQGSFGRRRVQLRKVGIGIGGAGLWITPPTPNRILRF